jgi:hypothetical protein
VNASDPAPDDSLSIVSALIPAGDVFVLPLAEKKLRIHGVGIALVAGDQLALACLLRVLGIVGSIGDGLRNGLALVHFQRPNPGCRQQNHPLHKRWRQEYASRRL